MVLQCLNAFGCWLLLYDMDASRIASPFFAALLCRGIVMRLLEIYGAWLVHYKRLENFLKSGSC
eukprot:COSAG01_NODE_932_length_12651_cov_50.381741_2_plen_64_part_00